MGPVASNAFRAALSNPANQAIIYEYILNNKDKFSFAKEDCNCPKTAFGRKRSKRRAQKKIRTIGPK